MSFEDTLRAIVREELRTALAELQSAQPAPRLELLLVADVARACKVAPKTVTGWISSGRLAARKAGRKWVVLPADLERFLARQPSTPEQHDDERVTHILSRRRHHG